MGSGQSTPTAPPPTTANLGADLKTSSGAPAKPRPCCVCTEEKSKRDECMLFSNADDAQKDCADLVTKYKDCMAGYGFKI
ncbi:cytochrome C oxidase copper chaperone-domain-containing protein [Dendryphion nanum]|uniref:Cytochrome C oxidase copper chaperone-domain-containing protein n=1 Tax=Dendryphion nanum TaxID=256645 RepID=A0A9P9IM06_9PLEO|nr:cytochrome C oxidase copper chaperone-domain-containing protein [Dendryphion nanum]